MFLIPTTQIINIIFIVQLLSSKDIRKRTQSFKYELDQRWSMSVMMNDESSYLNDQVYSKSKASLFKELTCMVMQSSHYIKSLPEVNYMQIEQKKVNLPYKINSSKFCTRSHNSKNFWSNSWLIIIL